MPTLLRVMPLVVSRLACAGFAVIAALSIPEVRQLLKGGYEQQGTTLYVPLTICEPSGIVLDGQYIPLSPIIANNESSSADVSVDSSGNDDLETTEGETPEVVTTNVTTTAPAEDIASNTTTISNRFLHTTTTDTTANDCHTLDFLVNACAMSFVFSIGAIAVFFLADILSRRGIGVSGAVVGMGLFLVFILLQTAVCTWALVSESQYWTEFFEDILDEHFAEYGIDTVKTYGNNWMLMATGASALACSVFLVLEALVSMCCRPQKPSTTTNDETNAEELPQKESLPTIDSTEHNSSSQDYSMSEEQVPVTPTDASSKQPVWAMTYANPFYH